MLFRCALVVSDGLFSSNCTVRLLEHLKFGGKCIWYISAERAAPDLITPAFRSVVPAASQAASCAAAIAPSEYCGRYLGVSFGHVSV